MAFPGEIKNIVEFIKTKYSAENRSEFLWFFTGQFVVLLLNFIIIKLLTSLGTEDYGKYSLILTFNALLTMIWFGPAMQGFNRFFYDYIKNDEGRDYLRFISRYIVWSGLIFLTILIVVTSGSVLFFDSRFLVFIIAAAFFIINFKLSEFSNNLLNIIRKRKINSITQVAEKSISALFLIALILDAVLNLKFVLAGIAVISLCFFSIKIYLFKRFAAKLVKSGTSVTRNRRRQIIKLVLNYSIPFAIWGFAGWLQLNGDKWIIAEFLSTREVGIYALMTSILNAFIAVPSNLFGEFLSPIIFNQFSDLNDKVSNTVGYKYIKINIYGVIAISVITFIIAAVLGKEIIILVSNPSFAGYWYLLPVISIGLGTFYTGQSMVFLGMALNKPKRYLFPKIFIGVLSIILNLILIKIWGLAGIAVTVLLIGFIYLFLIYRTNTKLLSENKILFSKQ